MKNFRKTLSIILSVITVLSSFAICAFAAEECTHSYSTTSVAPTCVEDGYVLYVCTLCGDNYKSYSDSLKAQGHIYGDWNNVKEATCTEEGYRQRDCSRCGASEVKTVSILEHIDADSNGACDLCSVEMKVEEIFSPFDWLMALFRAIRQWFADIFA